VPFSKPNFLPIFIETFPRLGSLIVTMKKITVLCTGLMAVVLVAAPLAAQAEGGCCKKHKKKDKTEEPQPQPSNPENK
jgi:hypothetical protein